MTVERCLPDHCKDSKHQSAAKQHTERNNILTCLELHTQYMLLVCNFSRLAITLVRKVHFQHVPNIELFHLVSSKVFSPQNLSWSYHRLTFMQMAWLWFVQIQLAITLVWKFQFQQFKHFYIACNELVQMEHLNQKCFSPQNLSWSYHRLTSMKMAWLWFVQVQLAITLVWKVQFQQFKHFCIACNELIHMEHLNQRCFFSQNLSWSYHRLTSMQMGLVVICSSSISHNFGLEGPIPTIQAFLYSL